MLREFSTRHTKKIVFSGIQPTGDAPHVGNYLGALKPWVELQREEESERLYSIVDLHALTTIDPKQTDLRNQTREMAAALLACGICPQKSIVYAQSDVVYHAELSWILSCVTPINHLQRMTQYKEKKSKSPNLGLFAYPVLQAADILLYRATHVPVGEDQAQHLELSRTIARSFNKYTGHDCLIPPTAMISKQSETSRVQSLRDATKKMSKSDPSDMSRINLTDDADTIAKKIRKAKTDSEPGLSFDSESRPGVSNLIAMYASFRDDISVEQAIEEIEPQNMGGLKAALTDVLIDKVCPIGNRMRDLLSDPEYLDQVLSDGALRAREKAERTMLDVRSALKIS